MSSKNIENDVIQKFKKFFDQIGNESIISIKKKEAPDFEIKVQDSMTNINKIIGIELTGILHGEFYKFLKTHFDKNEIVKITYPLEPYYVFPELIFKKEKKRENYKSNIGIDEIWLLIHDSAVKKNGNINYFEYTGYLERVPYIIYWFNASYSFINHGFSRMFYIQKGPESGFSMKEAIRFRSDVEIEFPLETLTETLREGISTFTSTGGQINIGKEPIASYREERKFESQEEILNYLKDINTKIKNLHKK